MKRKLTKSPNNVVLTGSLAGIADWLGIDPTIIRVVYVLLSFFSAGFPGILLYIALAKRKEAEKIDDDEWSDF